MPFPPSSRHLLFHLPSFITVSWTGDLSVIHFTGTWTEALHFPAKPSRRMSSPSQPSSLVASFSCWLWWWFPKIPVSPIGSCHLWRLVWFGLVWYAWTLGMFAAARTYQNHCSHVNQQQSSLHPLYLDVSSYLNHGQTKTAKGSNWIILSDKKRDKRGDARDKSGTARDKKGTSRDKTGTARDKTGTTMDKTGTAMDKKGTRA